MLLFFSFIRYFCLDESLGILVTPVTNAVMNFTGKMLIVKFLCDNHFQCRECLSHCRNMETSPGRVFDGSCSPPLAPGQAQFCQVIPDRGWSNLTLRYSAVHAHHPQNSQFPWKTDCHGIRLFEICCLTQTLHVAIFKTISSHPVIHGLQNSSTN